ncbi:putative Ig domain-containing protein [Larkinella terrae]|nr:putative Ig domain-containing protein [Larkinella terrae]
MEDRDYINSASPAPNPAVNFKAATSIMFDKGGNLYIACRYGQIYRIKRGETKATLILDIGEEVAGYGDHGVMGITLDRDHLTNGRFYIYYIVDMYYYDNFGKPGYDPKKSTDDVATIGRLTRYTVNPANEYKADLASRKILIGETLETGIPIVTPSHGGGGLATGEDGSILLGTGDAASFIEPDIGCNGTMTWFRQAIDRKILKSLPNDPYGGCNAYDKNKITENIGAYKAQVLFSHNGKVLRVNPENGDGYPSNPFYNAGISAREPQNRIYALGFRQAFRLTVRPNTGDSNPANGNPGVLYVGDVGFSYWEELNVVTAPGQNFGWPYYEGVDKGRNEYWKTEVFKPANPVKPRIQYRENKNTQVIQGDAVVSSDKRPLEGNCIIGGAWHEGGGNYPKEFQDTYYFADYGTGWIAGAKFGHDQNPEAGSIFKMATKMTVTEYSDRIVGMAFNPYDRNMYYITLGEKSLVRQLAFTTNQPPAAVITKDKSFGSSPLSINFSAKDSYDPEGGALTYEWNFGDGSSVNRTMTPPLKTFTNAGTKSYNVSLKVTDSQGKSSTTQTVISINNTPPVVESTTVDSYSQITLPQTINLNATASDAQTPAEQLTYKWTVYLYHNDHRHAISIINGRSGTVNLSEGTCDGEASYWYGMVLEVTDASGLTTTYTKYIYLACPGQQQTITFNPIGDKAPNTPPFRPPVSASSGLPVTLFSVDGPAVIENGQIKFTGGIGLVTIRATQHGNGTYKYAQPVERSFMVTNNAPSTPDTEAPSAPTGLAASNITQTSLQLNWNASTDNVGVVGYDVYRGGTKINTNVVNGTSFAVTGLTANTAYAFVVVARDAASNTSGNSNTANVTTLDAPANQPPTPPSVSSLSAFVNTSFTSAALAAFTDPENTPLTYQLLGLPGTLSFNATTRVITGTPTTTGTYSLTYSATDQPGLKSSVTFSLIVNEATNPGNVPPAAPTVSPLSAVINTAYTSAQLPAFTDTDPLTYSLTGLPNGLSFNASNRVISGTPTQSGTFTLVYTANDGKVSGNVNITLTVTTGAVAPAANYDGYLVLSCNTISGWAWERDRGNAVVTVELFEGSSIANGTLITTIAADVFQQHLKDAGKGNGIHWFDFPVPESLKDGQNHTIWGRVQGSAFVLKFSTGMPTFINCPGSGTPNAAPVAPAVSPLSATINAGFQTTSLPVFTDAENDPLTYTLTGLPNGMSFNAGTREISGTPTVSGTFTLTYSATDNKHSAVSTTLALTVNTVNTPPANEAPVAPAVSPLSATINVAFTANALPVFTDAENDPLTYTLTGLPNGLSFNASNRVISGTPTQSGTFTLTYSATDNKHSAVSTTFALTVHEANNPPSNVPPAAPTVSPLSAVINTAYTSAQLPAFTDTDPLTYSLTGLPNGLSFNASTRVISGTPTQSGTFTLVYAANDGKVTEDVNITLTVTTGAVAPAANFDGYLVLSCGSISGWAWERDRGNAVVTVELFEGPSIANGTFITAIPANIFQQHLKDAGKGNGIHGFDFPVPDNLKDGQNHTIWGRVQGSAFVLKYSTGAPTFINCPGSGTPTNAAPVAPAVSPLSATINVGFTANALPVFTDAENDPLTYTLTGLPNGLSFNASNRVISGTPTASGTFTLTYSATDNKHSAVSTSVTLTVNAGGGTPPANAAPVAPAVSPLSATINVAFTASALPVFTDAENDPLTYTLTGLPNGLSFNASNRVISGTPTASGTSTLTYSATDNKHAAVSTTFTLTVNTAGGTTDPPPTGGSGPGNYEGYLDVVECGSIQGWIWDKNRPNTPITVEFVEGSTVVGTIDANIFRQDLKNANKGNGIHGYAFTVPASLKDGKPHSISGRVPGGNFTLKWSPKVLTCPAGSRQGVGERVEISMDLSVSPNPSRGRVEISYRVEADQWADLQIVDMMGRPVWQKPMIGTGKVERETVDLAPAGANLYLIQLQTAKQIVTKRLLINR